MNELYNVNITAKEVDALREAAWVFLLIKLGFDVSDRDPEELQHCIEGLSDIANRAERGLPW